MASINNIDLRDLKRFKASLKQMVVNNTSEKKNSKLDYVGTIAYDVLNRRYSTTEFSVDKPVTEKGKCVIYARGEGIAFDEFGTGFYAKGSYKGELPTQTLTFVSADYVQTTDGWEYYYTWQGDPKKNPKREYEGVKGWFTKKEGSPYFHTGNSASNRFYDAVVEIKGKFKVNSK